MPTLPVRSVDAVPGSFIRPPTPKECVRSASFGSEVQVRHIKRHARPRRLNGKARIDETPRDHMARDPAAAAKVEDGQQKVEAPRLIGGWPEHLRTAPRAAQPAVEGRKRLQAGIEQRVAGDQPSNGVASGQATQTDAMSRHIIAHHQVCFVARRPRRDGQRPMGGVEMRPILHTGDCGAEDYDLTSGRPGSVAHRCPKPADARSSVWSRRARSPRSRKGLSPRPTRESGATHSATADGGEGRMSWSKAGRQLPPRPCNHSTGPRRRREAPEKKALLASPRPGGVRAGLGASRRPARIASQVRRAAQNNARPLAPPGGARARPIQPRSIWPAGFRTFNRCSG